MRWNPSASGCATSVSPIPACILFSRIFRQPSDTRRQPESAHQVHRWRGQNYYDRTDWWTHILSIPSPRIVVLEDVDAPPGIGSLVGEIHANILHALGCVGVVTNGAVRDLPAAHALKFQMFAGNVSVSHAYAHVFEFGCAVTVGGMKVLPGDLLHGDAHGVLKVPLEIADKVADASAEISRKEKQIIALCQSPISRWISCAKPLRIGNDDTTEPRRHSCEMCAINGVIS